MTDSSEIRKKKTELEKLIMDELCDYNLKYLDKYGMSGASYWEKGEHKFNVNSIDIFTNFSQATEILEDYCSSTDDDSSSELNWSILKNRGGDGYSCRISMANQDAGLAIHSADSKCKAVLGAILKSAGHFDRFKELL